MKSITEPQREVPVSKEADVVVAGGGPAGILAALSAARNGAKTVLIERYGFLGGNATMHLPLDGFLDYQGNQVIRGIAEELMARLRKIGGSSNHCKCPLHASYTIIEPEKLKSVALEMIWEAGVDILLHTLAVGTIASNGSIDFLLVSNKTGRQAIKGKVFIDCTGDADIAALSGADFEKGSATGEMQPGTLELVLRGVDREKFRRYLIEHPEVYEGLRLTPAHFRENEHFIAVGMQNLVQLAHSRDEFKLPVDRVVVITKLRQDEMAINMTRVRGVDGTSAESLTQGEIEVRKSIPEIVGFLRRYVPGFEAASLSGSAHQLGIRETRRIIGTYVLTASDVMKARTFPDRVAVASYFIDIHHSRDDSFTFHVPDAPYQIPYRCLLPRRVKNLIVAGRGISTTREAMAAIRVMPTCMATGEAAGCAAALSVKEDTLPCKIDVSCLQKSLKSQGMYLG